MSKFVPYLSETQIERDAAALLTEYGQSRGIVIEPPIPIEDIVEKHFKLGMEFDNTHRLFGLPRFSLGRDPDILGAIFFDEARVVIDESLDPDENPANEGRYRFTLAHEGGHWRLHRRLFAKNQAQAASFGGPAAPSVICRSSQAKTRVEWQADFYASCLLMPRPLIADAWGREFGTHRPFFFDPTKRDTTDQRRRDGFRPTAEIVRMIGGHGGGVWWFDEIARRFAPTFGVSPQAMRIRLTKLGLLRRAIPHQPIIGGE
jgi:Zn-dependent peptidase ImmA (M78 family)